MHTHIDIDTKKGRRRRRSEDKKIMAPKAKEHG
jgi:hypothetical protein